MILTFSNLQHSQDMALNQNRALTPSWDTMSSLKFWQDQSLKAVFSLLYGIPWNIPRQKRGPSISSSTFFYENKVSLVKNMAIVTHLYHFSRPSITQGQLAVGLSPKWHVPELYLNPVTFKHAPHPFSPWGAILPTYN